jgi:hypothetical protein
VGEHRSGFHHPVDHGLAAFAAQQVGDFRQAVGQDAAEPQQAGATAGNAEAGPPGGRRPGPVDRGRDLVGPGDRDSGDLLTGDRVGGDQQTMLDGGQTGSVCCGHDSLPDLDGTPRTVREAGGSAASMPASRSVMSMLARELLATMAAPLVVSDGWILEDDQPQRKEQNLD